MSGKGYVSYLSILSAKHTIFHSEFVYLAENVTETNCSDVTDMLTKDLI